MSAAVRVDLASVDWPAQVAISEERVLNGEPSASTLVLEQTDAYELGLWRITPGEFTTRHDGYLEYITVIDGAGQLIDDNGTVTALRPGTTVMMQPGWHGRWVVTETLTKAYAVLNH